MKYYILFVLCGLLMPIMPNLSYQKDERVKLKIVPRKDISGSYHMAGKEGKATYNGIVSLVKTSNKKVYVVQWKIENGPAFVGIGIREGNHFSVAWNAISQESPLKINILVGVMFMRIDQKDNRPYIHGEWVSLPGNFQTRTEAWMWTKEIK